MTPLDPHAAASPVPWMEWGPAAFERARREDKPILLRISAVWCHWCHVMDETTDADPEVARRIAEGFVAVRVDNDERPDINDRYNLGGWPTTAFLTPDGELITGGTYFPAEHFREILDRVREGWARDREALAREVERIAGRRRELRAKQEARGRFDGAALAGAVEAVLDAYDWRFGGFGTQPKFPHPEAVRLLLHAHAGTGAEAPLEAAEKTLTGMREAGLDRGRTYGLYDHEAGGFFRYSTTRDWSEPHFEKMSEENARLALAYLDGWRLTGDKRHAGTVRGIFGYMLETLSDPAGGAYGSQDADGEAEHYGLPLSQRAERPEPTIDRRHYTAWNGMLVAAALPAAAALGWPALRSWALATVERLTDRLATPEGAMRHVWRPGAGPDEVDARAPLLLADQAWWLQAVLAAYQASGRRRWRERAEGLAQAIERDFFHAARGACRDRAAESEGEGQLREPHFPLADNAAAAEALARYAALGGAERWRERAEGIVHALQPEAQRHGLLGAPLALAAAHVLAEPVQVHVVGPADDPRVEALAGAAWRRYAPGLVLEILDPAAGADRLSRLGYPAEGGPRAYVCIGERCLMPAAEPDALLERLDEARAAATAEAP